jgi:hypothetical protein
MFHVKRRLDPGRSGPRHAILQNNPMDQKIVLVFQGDDIDGILHSGVRLALDSA